MIRHATHSLIDTLFESVVEFTCQHGYQFSDGSNFIATQCLSTGFWSDTSLQECFRMQYSIARVKLFMLLGLYTILLQN